LERLGRDELLDQSQIALANLNQEMDALRKYIDTAITELASAETTGDAAN
jgi:hypothetical protein